MPPNPAILLIRLTIINSVLVDLPHIGNPFLNISLIVELAEDLRSSHPEQDVLGLELKEG